jgi:putative hemolysin
LKRSLVAMMICIGLTFAALVPAVRPVSAGSVSVQGATDPGTDIATLGDAARYCVSKGGEVDGRLPYFNTNDVNQQNWLRLGAGRSFCKFTSKKDGSRIHVLLSTLYSTTPTLAALAYYAKVPYAGNCNGNPASCYCSQLGGTDLFGGINFNGGGWVQKSDPVDTVLEACILPDLSSIDSWGLTYHQANIVRGKNLKGVLRYPDPFTK